VVWPSGQGKPHGLFFKEEKAAVNRNLQPPKHENKDVNETGIPF